MQSLQSRAFKVPHHSIARPCARPSRLAARPARLVTRCVVPEDKVFFDREKELQTMQLMLAAPPAIQLMMGPPDCGKTALLGRLASAYPGKVLYLDLRQRDTTSHAAFAAELAAELEKQLKGSGWPIILWEFKLNFGVGSWSLGSMSHKNMAVPSAPGPLERMQETLEEWITDAAKQAPAKPLIIIDEANRLTDWKEDAALQGLLDMFVRVTKQERKCHLILGTLEGFMYYWLQQRGLHKSQFETMTLGNLSEEAAKGYVGDVLLPGISSKPGFTGFTLEPSMWPQLYAMCGGNFGALLSTARSAAVAFGTGSTLEDAWNTAFREKLMKAKFYVDLGFNPANLPPRAGQKPAWTRKQWWAALEELIQAPLHVVPEERMRAVLGGEDQEAGLAALESLVRFNLLSLRTKSKIAFDLPPEVYGDNGEVTVVTVPYQAHLVYILSGKWKEGRQV